MVPTKNVSMWTNQYKEESDIYLCFLNECTENSDTHIKSVDLYKHFKDWFITNNPNQKIPTSRYFIKNLKMHKSIEAIKFNGRTTTGIKNLKINKDTCNNEMKYSKIQIEWLEYIKLYLGLDIQHAENEGEYNINNSKYYADGYDQNINTIFEYNGCHVHGCIKCYTNRNGINKETGKTYDELLKGTNKKKDHCVREGYNYVDIWDCDWKKYKRDDKLMEQYLECLKNELFNKKDNEYVLYKNDTFPKIKSRA